MGFFALNALKEIILVFIYDVKDKGVYLDAPWWVRYHHVLEMSLGHNLIYLKSCWQACLV